MVRVNIPGFRLINQDLQITGQVRDIVEMPGKRTNDIIFLRNDDYPVLYQVKNKKKLIK